MDPPLTEGLKSIPAAEGTPRIAELDGLRGLAILLVLLWHYFVCLIQPEEGTLFYALKKSLWITMTGVDLFFVLSGFLLGGLLMDHARSPNYYKTFYGRRAVRILPLYYLVVLLFALALHWQPAPDRQPAFDYLLPGALPLWSYATFTQNFVMAGGSNFGANGLGVTWSLAIEEQFYLVLPLLLRAVPRAQLPNVLSVFIVMAPLCRIFLALLHDRTGFSGYVLTPGRADALLVGVWAAWALRENAAGERLARNPGKTRLAGALALAATAGLGALGILLPQALILLLGHTWFAFFYAFLVILAVSGGGGLLSRLARHRWLGWLGRISYGVYLFHQPVLGLVHGFGRDQQPILRNTADALTTAGALGLTLALAGASWRWIERPIIALGHRLKY